ncbi:MAG: AAA family ATPase [Candidatus Omnitrophica bacterium]|nr:AAA family ATPase [Candidatus Omnitrophota bacterium]MDD5574558.1 AAA family ATPase [Candidatus Omnitrophota bacterium]
MIINKFTSKKIKMFVRDHWVAVTSTLAVLILTILSIIGFMGLESFYRKMQLAQLPIQIMMWILASAISAIIYVSLMFGRFGQIDTKKVKGSKVNVLFSDVLGVDEAKEEAIEVVNLLKDHSAVQKVGGKIIKGLLMIGPPGCGKTYLAKAIATEAGLPFLSLSASEFTEIFVGVGARRVRKLFKQARRLAYAHGGAIVFIDEIDAIGRTRTFSFMSGQEGNTTLNQLLVEMDGLQDEKENVVVIGATNSPEDVLDPAILRPGRFDRKIYIEKPNLKGREDVLKFYLNKVNYDKSIDIGKVARQAVYKSPADLENIVKEASIICLRNKRDVITHKDLSEAMERIDLGIKHRKHMTPEEKRRIAYHEAGHLIVLYLLHPTDDVFKASIIARGGTLGVVHHQQHEEMFTSNKDHLLADIQTSLAGHLAEKLKCGTTSDGVGSDFPKAMHLAHLMVWCLGMDGKHVGDFTVIPEGQLSEQLKNELNIETQRILQECLAKTETLLRDESILLDRFANELLKKEELEFDEIDAIFKEYHKVKFGASPTPPLEKSL